MNIVNFVQSMGGVDNLHQDGHFKTISKSVLDEFFDTKNPIFCDYVEYMEIFGGETYFNKSYQINPVSPFPEYRDETKAWHVDIDFGGTNISIFFGEGGDFDEEYTLTYNLNFYKDRIPTGYLPIANDVFGNLILMAVSGKNIGKIYFWEHEYDPNPKEFFNDYKIPMPEEIKFRNMFCIGNNLYDCFQRMILIEN